MLSATPFIFTVVVVIVARQRPENKLDPEINRMHQVHGTYILYQDLYQVNLESNICPASTRQKYVEFLIEFVV